MSHVAKKEGRHRQDLTGAEILGIVRDHGLISRIEIARATGLHKATVTQLVSQLLRTGYLEETGELRGGRKPGPKRRLLRFQSLARVVGSIDIRGSLVVVAITDLNARILVQDSFTSAPGDSLDNVLATAAKAIRTLLKSARQSPARLAGIGMGISAIVDSSTGTLIASKQRASWQGQSLCMLLEEHFRVPVYAENRTKAMALGEYLFGVAKGIRDFIYLWVGDGVGAGIVINGQVVHGTSSTAGGINWVSLEPSVVNDSTFPFTFRGQHTFGEILTEANLLESYRRHAPHCDGTDVTLSFVAGRSRLGDQAAQQILDEFLALLSLLCMPMVNALNPGMLVIGGTIPEAFPPASEVLQAKIHRDVSAFPADAVRVRCAAEEQTGAIRGIAGLVLRDMFVPGELLYGRSFGMSRPAARIQPLLPGRRNRFLGLRIVGLESGHADSQIPGAARAG